MKKNEIEAAIVGICLNYPKLVKMLPTKLPIKYIVDNVKLFEIIYGIITHGHTPDIALVHEEYQDLTFLQDCQDIGSSPTALDSLVSRQIEIFKQCETDSVLRNALIEGSPNRSVLIDSLKSIDGEGYSSSRSFDDLMRSTIDEIYAAKNNGGITGIEAFGIQKLDTMLGGLKKGRLTVVAGRAGQGKSILATTIIRGASVLQNYHTYLWSLEMTGEEQMSRLLSSVGSHSNQQLQRGEVSGKLLEDDAALIYKAKSRITVSDKTGVDINYICAEVMRKHSDTPIDILIIDHGGLVSVGSGNRNTAELKGEVSAKLKVLAKELNMSVVLLWQLNRVVESRPSKIPQLQDLRDSGKIEEDADSVVLIFRPDYYGFDEHMGNQVTEDFTSLIVAKNRGGATGYCDASFSWKHSMFKEYADPVFDKVIEIPKPDVTIPVNHGRQASLDSMSDDSPFA